MNACCSFDSSSFFLGSTIVIRVDDEGKRQEQLAVGLGTRHILPNSAVMSATSKLSQKMAAIANAWPIDPFRPNIQTSKFLLSLSKHPNLTPEAVNAARALQQNEAYKKVRPIILCREHFSYCVSIQYPLSKKMLEPASMPHHYTRLVEAFEKSAQGIARPWWKVFFNIW